MYYLNDSNVNYDVNPAKHYSNEEIAKKLREGKEIPIGPSGDASGEEQSDLKVQPGKLAVDPSKLRKNEEIAKKLREGKQIPLGPSGDATGEE